MARRARARKGGYEVTVVSFTGEPHSDYNGAAVKIDAAAKFREDFSAASATLRPADFADTKEQVLSLARLHDARIARKPRSGGD